MHTFKVTASIAGLLAVIIAAGLCTVSFLRSSSEKLENHITVMESNIASGHWEKAGEELSSLEQLWDRTQKKWTVLLDHSEIDSIDTSLSRLSNFIASKSQPLSLGETAVLRQYIRHIPEKESFTLKNVF